ncbi:MAG: site-specific integrase [Dehalobacterium sp.]
MKAVEPIRDPKKINAMKKYLKGKNLRDYVMFTLGVNIALRISDLLELTWGDVLEGKNFKNINLKEGKTQKIRNIKLNQASQKTLEELLVSLDTYDMDDYIFRSREGDNKPITRQQALNILKDAAEAIGIKENIGTHTLRKTWGYHAWKIGYNPALIMETLNHSNLNVTKRYLGIRQDEINDLYDNLNI